MKGTLTHDQPTGFARRHSNATNDLSSLPELPHDLADCHLLIRQLQGESQRAAEQAAAWESKARDAEARVDHLQSLVAEYQETVARHEETVERLAADNKLLKRCLFGSRRERYTDDPRQTLLFDPQAAACILIAARNGAGCIAWRKG
jgi:chromosome segregation ATPase